MRRKHFVRRASSPTTLEVGELARQLADMRLGLGTSSRSVMPLQARRAIGRSGTVLVPTRGTHSVADSYCRIANSLRT